MLRIWSGSSGGYEAMNRKGISASALSVSLAISIWGVSWESSADHLAEPETASLSEEMFFDEELPVVLSATRIQQPLSDVPVSMTVIDRQMIDASAATEIVELFRLVPGFQVGYQTGSRFTVTYHGVADQYARDMQVLIDGRSVYDPAFGGVSWSDLPISIDDILRIEVIRGPNAAAYGSNSFAGVINIITYHPATQQGNRISTLLGEAGTRNITLRHAGNGGDMDYRFSVGYEENDGFNTRPDSSETRWINFRGDYAYSPENNLSLQLGYSKGDRGDGFYVFDPLQPQRETNNQHHFQQLRWTHTNSPDDEYSLQFYHNYQRIDDVFEIPDADVADWLGISEFHPLLLLTENFAGLSFESHRYDLEFQRNMKLGDWRLAWGLGMRHDIAKGEWVFHTDDELDRTQVRAFLNAENRIADNLTLNLGGMVEHFSDEETLFSPRASLNWHLDARNTIRLSGSRAYRMPTLFEENADIGLYLLPEIPPLHPDSYIGPLFLTFEDHLDAQEINSFELAYVANFPKSGVTLDAKLFHEEITSLIAGARSYFTGVEGYVNHGETELNGFELDLNWRPSSRSLIHFGYSYTELEGFEPRRYPVLDESDLKDLSIKPSAPVQSFNLLGSYRIDSNLTLSSAFYYSDPISWRGDGSTSPGFHRLDLKLSKDFMLPDFQANVAFMVQNLGNEYTDFYNKPDAGRLNTWDTRAFIQASINWH